MGRIQLCLEGTDAHKFIYGHGDGRLPLRVLDDFFGDEVFFKIDHGAAKIVFEKPCYDHADEAYVYNTGECTLVIGISHELPHGGKAESVELSLFGGEPANLVSNYQYLIKLFETSGLAHQASVLEDHAKELSWYQNLLK